MPLLSSTPVPSVSLHPSAPAQTKPDVAAYTASGGCAARQPPRQPLIQLHCPTQTTRHSLSALVSTKTFVICPTLIIPNLHSSALPPSLLFVPRPLPGIHSALGQQQPPRHSTSGTQPLLLPNPPRAPAPTSIQAPIPNARVCPLLLGPIAAILASAAYHRHTSLCPLIGVCMCQAPSTPPTRLFQ